MRKPVLTRADMRRLDAFTIDNGTRGLDLMERAGELVAEFLMEEQEALAPTDDDTAPRVLVLAGPGNNGGDGFVVARLLADEDWDVTVALCARKPADDTDAGVNLERWTEAEGAIITMARAIDQLGAAAEGTYDLVVDALFGTGLDRPLDGRYVGLVAALNESRLPVVAVDLPSGLCADTGEPLGLAVVATATVTLGAAKPGLFVGSGPNHVGWLEIADIGLAAVEQAGIEPAGFVIEEETASTWVPRRQATVHKGDLGHVLVSGGSPGKSGAVLLAARAALRAGAGLVTMAVPGTMAGLVDLGLAEAMTLALADDGTGQVATGAWQRAAQGIESFGAIVVGPGLGTGLGAREWTCRLVEEFPGALVVDADALNVLAELGWPALTSLFARRRVAGHRKAILTPHPGEMGRLLAVATAEVQGNRAAACRRLAGGLAATVVLKGAGTLVADGTQLGFNTSGNAGMATAGMGDVLSGIIATLAVQMDDTFAAACLGVFVHGAAGDLLSEEWDGPGYLAGELADSVPQALSLLRGLEL
jgi:NAD(P)H-hydrate epimerase